MVRLQCQQVLRGLTGLATGAEDRTLVFLEDLQPGRQVLLVAQLSLGGGQCAEKRFAHFCDQLLEGIGWGAERVPPGDAIAVQARSVTRPVSQLM